MKVHVINGSENLQIFLKDYKPADIVNICVFEETYTVVTAKKVSVPVYAFYKKIPFMNGEWKIDRSKAFDSEKALYDSLGRFERDMSFGFNVMAHKEVVGYKEVDEEDATND